MGGTNPYIQDSGTAPPKQPYEVTFLIEETGEERKVTVDPAALPYGHDGLPGSILDIAMGADVPLDHACGGVCACSTCHVRIELGAGSCNPSSDAEEDMLDEAAGVTDTSRLGCQVVPDGSTPVVVVIPSWNRNQVKEEHH